MKKVFLLAVIITAFAFASFAESNFQRNSKPTLFAYTGPSYPYNGSYTYSFDGAQFYNGCTNELMTLSGSIYVSYHGVYNDNKSKFSLHINVMGIKAVGESGRTYQISGTNNIQDSYSYANGVYTFKGVQNERWTTAGGGNNFTISSTYFVTFDAYGNVTVRREPTFEVYCQ